jgi:hypothetical protein
MSAIVTRSVGALGTGSCGVTDRAVVDDGGSPILMPRGPTATDSPRRGTEPRAD